MPTTTVHTHSAEETHRLAARLGPVLRGPTLVALYGELGAGKTAFVRGLAEGLEIDPRDVSSPTFVICQEYGGHGPRRLVHIDAYRLIDPGELEGIGFEEILTLDDAVVAVEWADRLEPVLPADRVVVHLRHQGPQQRSITVTAPTVMIESLKEVWPASEPRVTRDAEMATPCPICSKPVDSESHNAPFCSARCRQVDLGRWFDGSYRVSRPMRESDEA